MMITLVQRSGRSGLSAISSLQKKYIETVRADEKISLKNLGRLVQKDWNMTVSRSKLGRARKLAQRLI